MRDKCDLTSCRFCIFGYCEKDFAVNTCPYKKSKMTIQNMAQQLEHAYHVIGEMIGG